MTAASLPQRLAVAEASYQASALQTDKLRTARNALVDEALADGLRKSEIARITGLTRGRVGQIANRVPS